MSSFDIPALIAILERPDLDLGVVTLRIEDAPEVPEGATVTGRYLDLDDRLRVRFRTGLRRSLSAVRTHPVEDYEAGWVSIDERLADASIDELAGPILPTVVQTTRRNTAPDFDAELERRAQEEDIDRDHPIGAYVVLARPAREPTAMFLSPPRSRRAPHEEPVHRRSLGEPADDDGGRLHLRFGL